LNGKGKIVKPSHGRVFAEKRPCGAPLWAKPGEGKKQNEKTGKEEGNAQKREGNGPAGRKEGEGGKARARVVGTGILFNQKPGKRGKERHNKKKS